LCSIQTEAKILSGISGKCGKDLSWKYIDDNSVATSGIYIYGKGKMFDYEKGEVPWYAYRKEIKNVIICQGVVNIGENAFYEMNAMQGISIAGTVLDIKTDAFEKCSNNLTFYVEGSDSYAKEFAIRNDYRYTLDTVPSSENNNPTKNDKIIVKQLKYKILNTNNKERSVSVIGAKSLNIKKISIPSNIKINKRVYKVTAIEKKAFLNAKKLKEVIVGKNINKIGKNAFYNCKNIVKFTIKTTKLSKKSIGSKAFAKMGSSRYSKGKVLITKNVYASYRRLLHQKGLSSKIKISVMKRV
jgi:hypothetical protein